MRTLLIFILSVMSLCTYAQNLDKMSEKKRNPILIEFARNAVKKYAPDYYREYGSPTIERFVFNSEEFVDPKFGYIMGRVYYRVVFPYDKSKEYFENGHSASVDIWADKGGRLRDIMPGNGPGRRFKTSESKLLDKKVDNILPYVKRERPVPLDFRKK